MVWDRVENPFTAMDLRAVHCGLKASVM